MNFAKILKTIKVHKKFVVTTHISPDADAISSQLAMAIFLKKLGKKVHVINAEALPPRFKFMPKSAWIKPVSRKMKLDYEVMIVVDCADLGRIDKVKELVYDKNLIINIDHHLTNDHFGHINYVDAKASSTAEVLYDFLKQAKVSLTKDMAMLLYLGIMTDTGSFRYDSTTRHSHAIVAELMRFDFSVSSFYRQLYEQVPLRDVEMLVKILPDFEAFHNARVLCVTMTKKKLDQFSPEFDVRDKIFSFLRAIKGVEAIIILTECEPNLTRANFRAQGNRVNVAELAAHFKGGGHRKASGCIIEAGLTGAKQKILTQLEKIL